MRLDKLISKASGESRATAKKRILSGQITIDGKISRSVGLNVSGKELFEMSGKPLIYRKFRYILLNKPKGYVCSTKDEDYPSALNLLELLNPSKLHFAGRLDVDTTGMVLISDDGQWTHRVTSPKNKQYKYYVVETYEPLPQESIDKIANGVKLKDSTSPTLPAIVAKQADTVITLGICEGRYHQVKRMIAAVGSRVTSLHRNSIGNIKLDKDMQSGDWRYLTEQEVALF